MQTRRATLAALAATAAAASIERAAAQAYPSRPITMIVPIAAGGSGDTLGRIIAESIRQRLGQPVIVENVGGAGGSIGAGRAARAPADGYTLLLGNWATQVVNGAVYPLAYDIVNDFEPVALIARVPLIIVARKDLPPTNLSELIAWLRANPDKALQGTNGPGSVMHLAGALFQNETHTHFQFVSYRGAAPAVQALMSGQLDLYLGVAVDCIPQVHAGTIKSYAITAPTRSALAPEIPTVDDAGLPGFYVSAWQSLWAPKGTSTDVIAKLNAAVVAALDDRSVVKRLVDIGFAIPPPEQQTPQALRAFQKAEIATWWPVIKAANVEVR